MSRQHSTSSLLGMNILVTRPEHQARGLCELIESHGGTAIRFPVLEITDSSESSSFETCLKNLAEYDLGIFISANAVTKLFQHLDAKSLSLPNQIKLAVIGKGTKRLLDNKGIKVDVCPEKNFNSDALLAIDSMQQVKGKRIVIFKGEGGRDLLENTLKERGAIVDNMLLYKRVPVKADPEPLLELWQKNELHIVTTTSNEGLQALFDIVGSEGQEYLRNTPLVIISERMHEKATELGIRSEIIVAASPDNDSIMDAINLLSSS